MFRETAAEATWRRQKAREMTIAEWPRPKVEGQSAIGNPRAFGRRHDESTSKLIELVEGFPYLYDVLQDIITDYVEDYLFNT